MNKMRLFDNGAEVFSYDDQFGIMCGSISLMPQAAFTNLNGESDVSCYYDAIPDNAIAFDEAALIQHMKTLRQNIDFDEIYDAHFARFPGEAIEQKEYARKFFN